MTDRVRGRDAGFTDRPVTWAEFKQRCRAHKPEELLRTLAALSAERFDGRQRTPMTDDWNPWAVAAVLRENLAYADLHRSAPVTPAALQRLLAAHTDLEDPFLRDPTASPWDLILRTVYHQFGWNDSIFNDLARFAAMLDRAFDSATYEVLTTDTLTTLLDAPLLDFQAVAFLATVAAQRNQGQCKLSWFDLPHFEPVTAVVSADRIRTVFQQSFTAPLAVIAERARSQRNPDPALRVYDFNPLITTPYVGLTEDLHIAPLPRLVADKASIASVYFRGATQWGNPFTRDLGTLVETYSGEQLSLVPKAALSPEREYKPGSRSVDWILDLTEIAVLVEVKSARVGLPGRLTAPAFFDDVNADVGKAMTQIQGTVNLIRDSHPAFSDIPPDRNLRGLIITAEPHHLINSPIFRQGLPDPGIPTTVVSLAELEHSVAFSLVVSPSKIFDDLTNWRTATPVNVKDTFIRWNAGRSEHAKPRNPLLDAAWDRLPWRAARVSPDA